ncbi:MAG: IS66 family transposase [Bacteroidota bacterium]
MTIEQQCIRELKEEIAMLKLQIKYLIEENEKLRYPKNSNNSSIPPSKDENRITKTKSLRKSNGRKPGGQTGHEGSTLTMTDIPDEIIEHKPQFCNHCGKDLTGLISKEEMRRQVVDIPPIIPQYIEHRIFSCECSCGHITESSFPLGVNAPISYGANIESVIAYLHTRQFIPFDRMREFFSDVCNLPISTGTICDILNRFSEKALSAYEVIADKVKNSFVIGVDETGAKVNGKKGWFWTWQSKVATFITFSKNRGMETVDATFPDGFPQAIFVHDCWKCHFNTDAARHQVCTSHSLRELKYLEERYNSSWATEFKLLLYDSLKLKESLTPADYLQPIFQRTVLENVLNKLLVDVIPDNMKEVLTFQKRMIKYKNYIFTFLYLLDVPPDNNASERAIRNIKVKQKVSGQFKTANGAQTYAIIRSITDTCIKNGQNILTAFKTIANLQPE